MPDAGDLAGRSGIVDLFDACVRRNDQSARDLPVIVLLGPRGSGRSWTLEYLRKRCRRSVAIPYAMLDCEADRAADGAAGVWRLVCDLADELHARWQEFGWLRFPRVTLARLAVEPAELPDDLELAQERLREVLRERARLRSRGQAASEVVVDVGQAVNLPLGGASLIGRFVNWVVVSRRSVDALYRTGLAWFATRAEDNHTGLAELVALNRLFHSRNGRDNAERILVDAFLADVRAAFAKRRPCNCVVLLDNCDTRGGRGLLGLVAASRAASRTCDPVVVVAASRTVPALSGLRERWTMPWSPESTGRPHVPGPESVDYGRWRSGRANRHTADSWWLPVHLRDLTLEELGGVATADHRHCAHRLTGGHPWSARRLLAAMAADEAAPMRAVLDGFVPRAEYLLADLSGPQRRCLVRWSAARDIDFASGARIGPAGSEVATDLHNELERRLWLVRGEPRGAPRLHPWLRRVLLCELTAAGEQEWRRVNGLLLDHANRRGRFLDAAYHALACCDVSAAVDYLSKQLDRLDAEHWIGEFDEVTTAPSRREPADSPVDQHETLLRGRSEADRADGVRNVLWSLVVARWIWTDPVGDPTTSLNATIADGFTQLAAVVDTGMARYRREAGTYRDGRWR